MMRLPPRKSRSSRSTPSLFNYLLRPSGALLAAALKTSSKSRLRKKIPICVDLKDLWTSFVPALDGSAATNPPNAQLLRYALLEDPDLRFSKTHGETKDLLFLGVNLAGLQINT